MNEESRKWLSGGNSILQDWNSELIDEIVRVTETPAPTFHEEERARYVALRFREFGYKDTQIDDAGNVVVQIPGEHSGAIMLAAHLDTVFSDSQIRTRKDMDTGYLHGPGVGDNSAHVAALLFLGRLIAKTRRKPRHTLILVCDTGEEGLGNLRGIKSVTCREADRLKMVVALDGVLGRVVNAAVGSRRYEVEVSAQGGHSWQDFGATSAVQLLAAMICRIHEMPVPSRAKTTFNVGRIEGGTSVNTIPASARMLVDLRSVCHDCLAEIEKQFLDILRAHDHLPGYGLKWNRVGDRPAGALAANDRLVEWVREALEAVGQQCSVAASSTDANFPISIGIPAISFGLFEAYGAHRPSECLNLNSLQSGMELLLRFWLLADEDAESIA